MENVDRTKEHIMKNIVKNLPDIIIAYLFHATFIILGFNWIYDDEKKLKLYALVGGLAYLTYFFIRYRERYMPMVVFLSFFIGSAAEVILNCTGVIPPDSGFFRGIVQAIHVLYVIIFTVFLAIVNHKKYSSYSFRTMLSHHEEQ